VYCREAAGREALAARGEACGFVKVLIKKKFPST
jgi:hypothetical protein